MTAGDLIRAWNRLNKPWLDLVVLRFFGLKCSLEEVRNKTYNADPNKLVNIKYFKTTDGLLDFAVSEYSAQTDRIAGVHDKAKVVLGVSGLLLALVGAAAKLWALTIPVAIILFLALFFLMLTIYSVLILFSVGIFIYPIVNNTMRAQTKEERAEMLVQDLMESAFYNRHRCDFLVDVYKASLLSIRIGVLLIATVVALSLYDSIQRTLDKSVRDVNAAAEKG